MSKRPAKKKTILIALVLITISGLGYFFSEMYGFANGVKKDTIIHFKWLQDNTKIYEIDVPPGLDTMTFAASITLDPTGKIHKIKLPNGGTETDIFIYDSTYLNTLQRNTLPRQEPLVHGSFMHDQDVLLDITSFKKGRYYVHYMSCNTGGIFPLTIN